MSHIRYEFIMSQIQHIRDIQENEKTKISLVFYEGTQGLCVLKVCKGRDLSEVYGELMKVSHPNVERVYDLVYEMGNTYVLEEYIPGKNLAQILEEKGPFSEQETTRIMVELCNGLEELHRHQPPIIHNDIKASNIMINESGTAKLFDFDISRTYKEGSHKNTKLMGTYEYAAPEHYGFGQSEPCTDIYSLGITMHEMLTGVGLDHKHNVTYQGGLGKIIKKCVEIDRRKRYPSAFLLKKALERYQLLQGRVFRSILVVVAVILVLLLGGIMLRGCVKGIRGPEDTVGDTIGDLKENSEDFEENSETDTNGGTESSSDSQGTTEVDSEETEGSQGGSVQGTVGGSSGNIGTGPGQGTDVGMGNDKVTVAKKAIKTVYKEQGTLLTMEAWPDGDYVVLEKISGGYYLRDLYGREKKLEETDIITGVELVYDRNTSQMYLWISHYTSTDIYIVDKELEMEQTSPPEYDEDSVSVAEGLYVIGGRKYSLVKAPSWENAEYAFLELGEDGGVVREILLEGLDINVFDGGDNLFFLNGSAAYFLATYVATDGTTKGYLYRFNGETLDSVACLNDYEGYGTAFAYEDLIVTDRFFSLYTYSDNAILRFEL